ncbi:MAG: HEAT repeat domain-containing protein [Verrucomicrobiota bacterium]
MNSRLTKQNLIIAVLFVFIVTSIVVFIAGGTKQSVNAPTEVGRPAINNAKVNALPPTNTVQGMPATNATASLDRAKQIILKLRSIATKTNDVQALCYGNAALFAELRKLGPDAVAASLDEIADKTSPDSLRIILIEMVTSMAGRRDDRVGQVLLAIITDSEDVKAVKMQALSWIPATGNQSAGAQLLELLPRQSDSDLEFAMTRALRGFQVPGSIDILRAELADGKTYLTRVAAYHALAKQGGPAALSLLQDSVAARLAAGSQENHPEENTVSLHGILALGEIPDASSLPILESVSKNPANSVSVRNTAIQTIATIGGLKATQFLRSTLQDESNESVLVYVARAMSIAGERADASACLAKAATVSDSFTKSELQKAAQELQKKGNR